TLSWTESIAIPCSLDRVISAAIPEGATTINVADTVGYATPQEYASMFIELYERVPALRDVVVSVHCHDDLGLAVANSLAGLQAGCRQVECAVNWLGERAGNTSLEAIVGRNAFAHESGIHQDTAAGV